MAYNELASFSQGQANQSFGAAPAVQDIADPYAAARKQNINRLQSFLDNPTSSPGYEFTFNQAMDNLKRQNAASGMLNSGNRLAAVTQLGQGLASQDYFKHGNFLAGLATQGSSPAAGALGWANMVGRGQNQQSIGAAARAQGQLSGQGQPQQPWWMQPMDMGRGGGMNNTGLPSGGGLPTSYSGMPGTGYIPSADAGTGYMQSDFGTTNFGGYDGGYADFGNGMPSGGEWGGTDQFSNFGGGMDDYGYDYGGEY